MRSDIEIAQAATMKPIAEIAAGLGIPAGSVENYGHYKANHNAQLLVSEGLADSPDGPKET